MVRGPSRTTYYRSRGTLLELGYVEQVMNKYFVKKPCKSGVPLVPWDYHGTNGTNQAAPVVDPVPSAFISYVQRTALSVLLYIRNGAPTKEVRGVDTERDISKGEAVEHELTAMIERRHDRRVVEEGERAGRRCVGGLGASVLRPTRRATTSATPRLPRGAGRTSWPHPRRLPRGGGQEVRMRDHGRSAMDHRIASCVLPFADLPDFVT